MPSGNLIDALNHNLLNEICGFLKPHEIVRVFSINKYFNKFWTSKIAQKIFPGMYLSVDINRRMAWKLVKIKYLEPENLNWPVKHFKIKEPYSLNTSIDPLKVVLLLRDSLITWLPESDESKYINIGKDACFRAYEGNTLAVWRPYNKIIFYSYDGAIKYELNFSVIECAKVDKMLCLNDGKYLLIVTKSNGIAFIDSLTGYIIIAQKHKKAISEIKILSGDTVVYISGKQLYKLSPRSVVPLIKLFKKNMPNLCYDQESQNIIINNAHNIEDSSFLKEKFGTSWRVNGLDLRVIGNKYQPKFLINEENSQMQYEIPKKGVISTIMGDADIFLVYLTNYRYEDQYIHVLYFCMWGIKFPFYEKYFSETIQILEVKFPYVIYKTSNISGESDFYSMRL